MVTMYNNTFLVQKEPKVRPLSINANRKGEFWTGDEANVHRSSTAN